LCSRGSSPSSPRCFPPAECSGRTADRQPSMSDEVLYKLVLSGDVPEDCWRTRLDWTQCFKGDQSATFISLLKPEQLASTVEASFAGKADVMLLSFAVDRMIEEADLQVKYEAAESAPGGEGPFAHVYGGFIPYACMESAPVVLTLADGKHVIPPLGTAVGHGGFHYKEEEEEASGTDDGLEAFDQHRFDEDD